MAVAGSCWVCHGATLRSHSGVGPSTSEADTPITHQSAPRGGRSLSSHASPLSTLLALRVFATDISAAKTRNASKVSVVGPAGGRSAPRGRNRGRKPMPSGNEGSSQRICVGRRAGDSPHLTLTRADERGLFVECRGFVVEAPAPGLPEGLGGPPRWGALPRLSPAPGSPGGPIGPMTRMCPTYSLRASPLGRFPGVGASSLALRQWGTPKATPTETGTQVRGRRPPNSHNVGRHRKKTSGRHSSLGPSLPALSRRSRTWSPRAPTRDPFPTPVGRLSVSSPTGCGAFGTGSVQKAAPSGIGGGDPSAPTSSQHQ